jgi:histidinol-phosphatase (PHP family)
MYNFHTHTSRCHHATGADRDYVISAIENGYDEIGFSDHAPYIFPEGHHSGFRMELEKAQEYVDSVHALQKEFKDQITIRLGFETEYYPALIEREIEFLKSFKYDYIILGQHYVDNEYEPYAKYSGAETKSVEILDKYINQLLAGAKSGYFTYVCHPDLINFKGDEGVYLAKMQAMIEELYKINIPLEFNFLGFTDKRQYPNKKVWQMIAEIGNRVVIGLDAHQPQVYGDTENLALAKAYLKDLGITPLEEIDLISYDRI